MIKLLGTIGAVFCFLTIANAQTTKTPVTSWQWNQPGNFLGWEPISFASAQVSDGALQGLTNEFPRLSSPLLSIDASQWVDLEFRVKSTVGGPGLILFSREGENRSDSRSISFSIVGDNQFHTYRVNLSSHPLWKGTVTQILFYPLFKAGAKIEVQSIRFLPKNSGGLISNGGFEINDPSGLPEKWNFDSAKVQIVAGQNSTQALQLQPEGQLRSSVFEFPTTTPHELKFYFNGHIEFKPILAAITFYDIFHQPIKTQDLNLEFGAPAPWRYAKSTFTVPALAAYGQIALRNNSTSAVTLDNVDLKAVEPTPAPWQEGWRANWIKPPNATVLPDGPRYFRRAFTVHKASNLTMAKIQLTGDDNARLFINGHELPAGENWDNWQKVDIYDVKKFLSDGANVIGVMTTNRPGSGGILAELHLQTRDSQTTINTDKTWRTHIGDVATNWDEVGFDNNGWDDAQELGIPPILPWHDLPAHSDFGLPMPNRAQLTTFNAPGQAKLGQKIDVQLEFVPMENSTHPTALQLQLVSKDSSITPFNFPPLPVDTSTWKKGVAVKAWQMVRLPKYAQAGAYSLEARLTFTSFDKGSVSTTRVIHLQPLPVASSPVTKVTYLPGHVPAFNINGKTIPVMHVMTSGTASSGVGKEIIENSRDNNINLIWLNIIDGFDWNPDAPSTFAQLDKIVASVLEVNPQAYIVLNVPVDPSINQGMTNWLSLHPDQLIKNSEGSTTVSGYDGNVYNQKYASFASKIWIDDASKSWRELIRHVRSGRFADRVIGYVPFAGPGAEWWYYGAQKDLIDYSEPFRQAFANWAKSRYNNDLDLLNKTWNTQFASFDVIQLPSKEQRLAAAHGMFLEPTQSGEAIDMSEFIQEVMADDVLQFCHIVKEETKGTAICGTYYGYVMHLGRPYFGAQSGHYALAKVLSSPDIDFLMSPSPYGDRGLGGGSGYMTTIDSFKLQGKLYINQSDVRTFRALGMTSGKVDTLQDSVAILERQFADAVVNGVAVQWYDFGEGWITGDKRLMQAVGKMHQTAQTLQHTPRETIDLQNSIAVITSEKSGLYTDIQSSIQYDSVDQSIPELQRTGVAWDSYILSDLPKLGGYHYYVFLNCFNLSDTQRKYIDENLKKDGNVLVWINSPGIIDDSKSTFAQATYDPNRVSEVTGFQLKQLPDGPLVTRMLPGNNPLQQDEAIFGNSQLSGTRFAPQDGVALGQFPDDKQTSLAIKKFADWTSIYSATPTLPAALLRNIAKMANVPVINNHADDVTYASKNLFSVHSLGGGKRVFTVGDVYKSAKELFSDQTYTVRNGNFTATMPPGGTMLFLLEK